MANLQSVQLPVSSLPIIVKLSIPGSPDWLGIDTAAVWASNQARASVVRIDPATNMLVGSFPVDGSRARALV